MFTIIGADQKEYGPVAADQIHRWIAEGRVNALTLARTEGGAWNPLSTYPEFSTAFASTPQPPPPVSSLSSPVTASSEASRLVQAPGIFLAIVGILALVLHVFSVTGHFFGWAIFQAQSSGNPELDRMVHLMAGSIGLAYGFLALGLSALIAVGGFRMMSLKNRGLCIAAAIIALVPCLSPCCCLGIPAGIWALIVLCKPEVKAAFERFGL